MKQAEAPAAKEEKKEAPKQEKKKEQKAPAAKTAGGPADELLAVFKQCDIRVGKVVDCKKHEESDKLYIEQIDLGEGRIR